MKKLANASLVIIDCRNYAQALAALKKAMDQMVFEKVLFLTDIDIPNIPDDIEIKKIPAIRSKDEYSVFVLKQLFKYIETDYFLLTQWDAEILDPTQWDDDFYNYDYIAASWPFETDGLSVGCGGFSWRSKRLHVALGTDDMILPIPPEDVTICRIYRRYLEAKYGFKWASEELADKFAFELKAPMGPVFGRHGFFHKSYTETICIRRQAALGDIVQLEPLLEYYHSKGYRVVLDTLPQFYNFFIQHYFKVHHPQEIDPRIKYKTINLDMSYESRPKQLHLQSYFEFCGISDYKPRNPRLTLNFDPKQKENKLFNKYCVLHLDARSQKARNIYDVDWNKVSEYLQNIGYTPVVIGRGEHPKIEGAVEMNTPTELMLMWVIGGADMFLGVDSGPSNIAVAMGIKSVILSGSVDLRYIYSDFTNIEWVHNHHVRVCDEPFCWHSTIGTEGIECVELAGGRMTKTRMLQGAECPETSGIPPCVQFSDEKILDAIHKIHTNASNS